MADSGNRMSVYVSFHWMEGILKEAPRLDIGLVGSGQQFGSTLEGRLAAGLKELIQQHQLGFLVASKADAKTIKPKPSFKLTDYWPYLTPPSRRSAEGDAQIYRALGRGHLIQPDVIIWRRRTMTFNTVKDNVCEEISIDEPQLFACISGKATIRSDRSQSSRYEGASMGRWRRARPPHIVVVTAEPFPSRLGSLAWGLGDLDAVYHVNVAALYEAVVKAQDECGKRAMRDVGSYDELRELIELARVKDLSQLFEDLFGEVLP
jgi:NgoMIV restriction enzyme.